MCIRDSDNRTARIVDALAQQVLAETSLFTPQHIRKALQGAVARACDRAAAAAIINEGIHRLLQHTLLVAHNDIGRTQLQQALEAVMAVNDPARCV